MLDLVGCDSTADMPGEKVVGDLTYIPAGEGRLHLGAVIECCTKEMIGYVMDGHYRTPLDSRATRSAARNRKIAEGVIFHSGHGSDSMSAEYGNVLNELGLQRSAGRTGVYFDNAMADPSSGC